MKKIIASSLFILISIFALSQNDNQSSTYLNSAEKLLATEGNLLIGGYGEVHYNQPLSSDQRENGKLDVHRVVMLFGYNFDDRTSFVTEIEYEHVKEVYIEQAFMQYKLNKYMNLRAGLLLVPMGIINEYHEPTTFLGVERPWVDKYIVPTTWREIGMGLSGNVLQASVRYQLYVMNGFNGYDGSAGFTGSSGLRGGRQKGAESFISSPTFSGKAEYYGIAGLNIGVSGYFGKSQSTLYDGLDQKDKQAVRVADSSRIGISMLGVDARYRNGGLRLRGQYYLSNHTNTAQYNAFTGRDLGSSMSGGYLEAGYNILRFTESTHQLIPFLRYSIYDTHHNTDDITTENQAYKHEIITSGLSWKMSHGAVMKADIQWVKDDSENNYNPSLNMGIGVMF